MAHASAWDRIRGFGLTSARVLLPGRAADPLREPHVVSTLLQLSLVHLTRLL